MRTSISRTLLCYFDVYEGTVTMLTDLQVKEDVHIYNLMWELCQPPFSALTAERNAISYALEMRRRHRTPEDNFQYLK